MKGEENSDWALRKALRKQVGDPSLKGWAGLQQTERDKVGPCGGESMTRTKISESGEGVQGR